MLLPSLVVGLATVLTSYYYLKMTTTPQSSYLNTYQSVSTSSYSSITPTEPHPASKQIADLYTQFIDLFIQLRYLEPSQVHFPPHTPPHAINLTHPARYGFTKNVIDLCQLIPYITDEPQWNFGSDHGEFLMGGEFMPDLRGTPNDDQHDSGNGDEAMRCTWEGDIIDPLYAGLEYEWQELDDQGKRAFGWDSANRPYIKPTYAVLSSCGNHGSVMILNTENWEMWLVEQLGGSSDPFFADSQYTDRYQEVLNRNDLSRYPSRSAVEFLEDVIGRFRSLEWVPGGLYGREWDHEYLEFRERFIKAGWPDNFDGEEFARLRAESDAAKEEFSRQTAPLEQLEALRVQYVRKEEWRKGIPKIEAEIAELETKAQQRTLSEGEKEELEGKIDSARGTLRAWKRYVDQPTEEDWQQGQEGIRTRLEEQRDEKRLFVERKGRFNGMTEQEHQQAMQEGWFDDQIAMLEKHLADANRDDREKRQEAEVRNKSKAVPQDLREQWVKNQKSYHGKNEQWEQQWNEWYEAT